MKRLLLCLLIGVILSSFTGCKNNPDPDAIFFPVATATNTQYPSASAHGRLVLENHCLRLKPYYLPFSKGYLLIWPYGYSLKTQDSKICVIDAKGEIVAKVGNWIKVGGGNVSLDIVEKYTGEPLPVNYNGPYWIVFEVVGNL